MGKQHEPRIHLMTDIQSAGSDLIEFCGMIRGVYYSERRVPGHIIEDIKAAIQKAANSVAAYEKAGADTGRPLDSDAYDALVQ